MSGLDISMSEVKQTTIIRLSGAVDMQEVTVLNRYLEQMFFQDRYNLVIDLSELHFTSSMGLGSLIRAYTKCRDHQGRLALVNPQPAVMRIIQTTQLDRLFNIYATLDEALEAII